MNKIKSIQIGTTVYTNVKEELKWYSNKDGYNNEMLVYRAYIDNKLVFEVNATHPELMITYE